MGSSADREKEPTLKDLKEKIKAQECLEEIILEEGEGGDGRDESTHASVI